VGGGIGGEDLKDEVAKYFAVEGCFRVLGGQTGELDDFARP
jgi:hypothetical protein